MSPSPAPRFLAGEPHILPENWRGRKAKPGDLLSTSLSVGQTLQPLRESMPSELVEDDTDCVGRRPLS